MKRQLYFLLILILSALPFTSCRKNIYNVNISKSEVRIVVKRLDKDLFVMDPGHIADSISYLKSKYGNFLRYFGYVINIGEPSDSSWMEGLVRFCTDRQNNEVYETVMKVFPSITSEEKDLSKAFSHYRYYFPGKKIPGIYTCITGFNNSIITGDSALGISLDRYLGQDCKYYPAMGLYKYQIAKMKAANILPDCMYAWGASEWDLKSIPYSQSNVLSDIIHEGKILFFVKCMLPDLPEEMIAGFTPEQMKFCRNNEGGMWQYLMEHNMLFSTDMLTRKKLTGEAPFTVYFTSESPGRAAAWIGFRIVESYMKENRSVTLDELMSETDIQKILQGAKYRPTRGRQ